MTTRSRRTSRPNSSAPSTRSGSASHDSRALEHGASCDVNRTKEDAIDKSEESHAGLVASDPDLALRRDKRGFLPALLDLPGRLIQRWVSAPEPLGERSPDLDEIARLARRSAWANGYLSVDSELRAFTCEDGVVTFATSGRTAFVVGGPHATVSGAGTSALLTKFRDAAVSCGYRRILLFPILEAERDAANAAGFDTVETGVEAFVDLNEFTLAGKEFTDLRQMRNRAMKRYGASVVELHPDQHRDDLERVYQTWLSERASNHRMTLVVGKPAFDEPRGRRYFGVTSSEGLQAFITLVPCFDGLGWGIDVMARPEATPAGAMDLLISEAAFRVRDEGAKVFSVGACPMALSDSGDDGGREHPLLRRMFRVLYSSGFGNRLFSFRSLHRYKLKFNPRWESVYMATWPRVSVFGLYVGCGMWGLFSLPWRSSPCNDPDVSLRK